jgi:hypothetical protein
MSTKKHPEVVTLKAALLHIDESITQKSITLSAAEGLLYSVLETLGVIVGDPDLPEHALSGYQGLQELGRELKMKIEQH